MMGSQIVKAMLIAGIKQMVFAIPQLINAYAKRIIAGIAAYPYAYVLPELMLQTDIQTVCHVELGKQATVIILVVKIVLQGHMDP